MAVVGCKIGAQQHEERYQRYHNGQAKFCKATLLPTDAILLPLTSLLCFSPTINSAEYAGVWVESSVTTDKGISTISSYHPGEPRVPLSLYTFLPACLNISHLLLHCHSQTTSRLQKKLHNKPKCNKNSMCNNRNPNSITNFQFNSEHSLTVQTQR